MINRKIFCKSGPRFAALSAGDDRDGDVGADADDRSVSDKQCYRRGCCGRYRLIMLSVVTAMCACRMTRF